MSRLFWYRHSPGDHLAQAADLSLEQDGALLRLRDYYWMNGPIPTDPAIATSRIRAPRSKSAMVAGLLARFFLHTDDGYVSPGMDDERVHARAVRQKRVEAGRLGGRNKSQANAKHLASDHITSHHSTELSPAKEEICTEIGSSNTPVRGGAVLPMKGGAA